VYLQKNADVAAAGIDPVLHYLRYGGFESALKEAGIDYKVVASQSAHLQDMP
jgi:hypothetical protein